MMKQLDRSILEGVSNGLLAYWEHDVDRDVVAEHRLLVVAEQWRRLPRRTMRSVNKLEALNIAV